MPHRLLGNMLDPSLYNISSVSDTEQVNTIRQQANDWGAGADGTRAKAKIRAYSVYFYWISIEDSFSIYLVLY